MADIISLDDKLRLSNEKKADLIKKRKIAAVQKVFQCTHCAFKCQKCGTHMSHSYERESVRTDPRIPYRLCESCSEEYLDYIERLQGGGDPACYWRNETWQRVWKTWIEYQGSIDSYMNSKAFIRLMNELKQTTPVDE